MTKTQKILRIEENMEESFSMFEQYFEPEDREAAFNKVKVLIMEAGRLFNDVTYQDAVAAHVSEREE